jgi:hypothetical protein
MFVPLKSHDVSRRGSSDDGLQVTSSTSRHAGGEVDRGSKPYRWAGMFGLFFFFFLTYLPYLPHGTYSTYWTYFDLFDVYPKAGGCRKNWMVFAPTGMAIIFILAMAIRFFNPVAQSILTLSKCHRIIYVICPLYSL